MQKLTRIVFWACLAFCSAALANPVQEVPNPIKDTTPFVKDDELKVFAFFKFNCPVCRNYHMALEYWGKSLPKPFVFQLVPVLEGDGQGNITDDSTQASMLFWTIERAGNKSQRAVFADAAYELNQDTHEQSNPDAWKRAVATTNISKQKFASAWDIERGVWEGRADRQIHYSPTSTPTLVICGKWMITPDSTNGDQELFIQLANGLVSKCIIEKGIAH